MVQAQKLHATLRSLRLLLRLQTLLLLQPFAIECLLPCCWRPSLQALKEEHRRLLRLQCFRPYLRLPLLRRRLRPVPSLQPNACQLQTEPRLRNTIEEAERVESEK